MSGQCPWCGSKRDTNNLSLAWYKCSTSINDPESRGYKCYKLQLARMQPVVEALGKYITDLRSDEHGMDARWLVVSNAWDQYDV